MQKSNCGAVSCDMTSRLQFFEIACDGCKSVQFQLSSWGKKAIAWSFCQFHVLNRWVYFITTQQGSKV